MSICQSEIRIVSPKEADTESTTVMMPYFLRRGQIVETSFSMPLGVSPVDNGCIFVIVMFFEEVFKFLHIESFTVISGIEFRDTTVHGNEIRESFAVYTVIQYKDMVTRFGHRSAGGLQSEDSFSAKNKSFVVGMEKTADLFTGFFVKFYEACIKIRIGAFSAAARRTFQQPVSVPVS